MNDSLSLLYTVGHSTHPIEKFVELLTRNQIEAIADVRSAPYSKYTPHFNRETLTKSLEQAGIKYVFLGNELGARREEPECYQAGKVNYAAVSKTDNFLNGIERLKSGAAKMRIAIMCAEKDPLTCHRAVLVAHYGRENFKDIFHILEDATCESQKKLDERLLSEHKLNEDDLFNPREERLKLAYAQRAEKIAYKEKEQEQTETTSDG